MYEPQSPAPLPPTPVERPPITEGEYLPPSAPAPSDWRKRAGASAVGVGVLAAKFKGALFVLLSFKGFFISLASIVVSMWFYALAFGGLKIGIAFVLLILIHEIGHVLVMRMYGVPGTLPFFIPGFGALVQMRGRPASAFQEAWIAFAGPLFGTLGAAICFGYGLITGERFWFAVAYIGFFINLFNLAPVLPLDGGRIIGAVSPRVWAFGLVALIVAMVAFHWFNPLVILLLVLSIPQTIAAWRGKLDPQYHGLTALQRGGVAAAYFGLAGVLLFAMLASHVTTPNQPTTFS